MSERAAKLASFLLEQGEIDMERGGMKVHDYSPEDLEAYDRLSSEQAQLHQQKKLLNPATGDFSPEWTSNWTEFEKLRNRYNGMPPRQRPTQPVPAKAAFYPGAPSAG